MLARTPHEAGPLARLNALNPLLLKVLNLLLYSITQFKPCAGRPRRPVRREELEHQTRIVDLPIEESGASDHCL